MELLSDLLKSLFTPSDESIIKLKDTVYSKFGFVDTINAGIKSFKDIINGIGEVPVLSIDLKETKFTDAMTIDVIDLNWYKPYKEYGDLVLTGIFYSFYLWRLYSRLPSIISGTGSGATDIIKMSNSVKGD